MSSIMRWRRGLMVGLRDGGNAGIGARHRAAPSISTDRPLKRPIQVPAPPGETSHPATFTSECGLKLPRSGLVQYANARLSGLVFHRSHRCIDMACNALAYIFAALLD